MEGRWGGGGLVGEGMGGGGEGGKVNLKIRRY